MKHLGWLLVTTAIVTAIGLRVTGREDLWLLAAFAAALLLGAVLLLSSFAIHVYRGDVQIRPLDAAKRAAIFFLVMLGIRQIVRPFFPEPDHTFAEDVFVCGFAGVVMGIYSTVYRKPE